MIDTIIQGDALSVLKTLQKGHPCLQPITGFQL